MEATTILNSYARRAVELCTGDIIHLSKSENTPQLKLGDMYNLETGTKIAWVYKTSHPAKGQVVEVIKNPPIKKWYQFWIKQQVVGYNIQIL